MENCQEGGPWDFPAGTLSRPSAATSPSPEQTLDQLEKGPWFSS